MTWQKDKPAGSDLISASDEVIRANWEAIQYGDVTNTRKVRLDNRDALSLSGDPTQATDVGYIYNKNVNSNGELHYIDEAGNVTQITGNGAVVGGVSQNVFTQNATGGTYTALIPGDNTKPQNTEGTEVLTLSVTPKSATSTLFIKYYCSFVSMSAAGTSVFSLFQDSTADALASTTITIPASNITGINLEYYMTSGTTSSTTFKVRAGPVVSGTLYTLLGSSGNPFYGSTAMQYLSITEYS